MHQWGSVKVRIYLTQDSFVSGATRQVEGEVTIQTKDDFLQYCSALWDAQTWE